MRLKQAVLSIVVLAFFVHNVSAKPCYTREHVLELIQESRESNTTVNAYFKNSSKAEALTREIFEELQKYTTPDRLSKRIEYLLILFDRLDLDRSDYFADAQRRDNLFNPIKVPSHFIRLNNEMRYLDVKIHVLKYLYQKLYLADSSV